MCCMCDPECAVGEVLQQQVDSSKVRSMCCIWYNSNVVGVMNVLYVCSRVCSERGATKTGRYTQKSGLCAIYGITQILKGL